MPMEIILSNLMGDDSAFGARSQPPECPQARLIAWRNGRRELLLRRRVQPSPRRPRGRRGRQGRMEGLAGRSRHGARTGHAIHRGRLGRLGRPARSRARPVRQRRHPDRAGAAQPRRPRDVLRGLQQRHPLAAVPRRHRAARIPPRLVGQLLRGQPAVRGCRGRHRGARRDRVGAGLPIAAGAPDAAAGTPGPHHRVLPPHPVPGIRHLLAVALAHADHRGAARRRRRRLPAGRGRRQLLARGAPPARILDEEPVHRGAGDRDRRPPGG